MIRILLFCMVGLIATPAMSQTAPPAQPEAGRNEPPPPPYEPQLLRLSEILGVLAFLQDLCGAERDGEELRKQMAALIDAEAATQQRKARFAGAYNKGFRGFEQTYTSCTANARLVVARYLAEGQQIAREVASRYGGG
jgi:uncharacterized protein (TIGR02301 family)